MLINLQYEIQENRNLLKIIVLIVFFAVVNSDLLLKPENTLARTGDAVMLQCNSSLKYRLNWLIKTPRSSAEVLIFDGYRVSRNVSSYCKVINGEPGKYALNVSATDTAAQKYICQEPGTLIKASAVLIIIESDPKCNVIKDGELTVLTCHMLLYGNWPPVMECRNGNSDEVIGEQVYMYNSSTPSEGLTSRLIVPTNQSQDPKMFYTCTTKFRLKERPSGTTANNIPRNIWNSTMQTADTFGGDVDNARETSVATGYTYAVEKEPQVTLEVLITSVVVIAVVVGIASAGLIIILIYCKKKNASNKNADIAEEATFISEPPVANHVG